MGLRKPRKTHGFLSMGLRKPRKTHGFLSMGLRKPRINLPHTARQPQTAPGSHREVQGAADSQKQAK